MYATEIILILEDKQFSTVSISLFRFIPDPLLLNLSIDLIYFFNICNSSFSVGLNFKPIF